MEGRNNTKRKFRRISVNFSTRSLRDTELDIDYIALNLQSGWYNRCDSYLSFGGGQNAATVFLFRFLLTPREQGADFRSCDMQELPETGTEEEAVYRGLHQVISSQRPREFNNVHILHASHMTCFVFVKPYVGI